jgi:acyl-CoA reductase-like NAD-dependent aldehyde dehydrogenase
MSTTEALPSAKDETGSLLAALGVSRDLVAGEALEVRSPITGEVIARVKEVDAVGAAAAIAARATSRTANAYSNSTAWGQF